MSAPDDKTPPDSTDERDAKHDDPDSGAEQSSIASSDSRRSSDESADAAPSSTGGDVNPPGAEVTGSDTAADSAASESNDASEPPVVAATVDLEPPSSANAAAVRQRASKRPPAREVELGAAVVALFIVASAVMVLWNLQDASLENANTGSRYATIESLVDYGTYHIDKSRYVRTIDKMKVGKHYISSKPPTLPTYGAGVYWAFQKVTGYKIAKHEGAVVWFVSLCTSWLAHVVFLIYLYRLSKILLQRQLAIIGTVAAGGFAYLGVAYATAINNHSTSAALVIVGFYYACRVRHDRGASLRHWILSGLCFGYAFAVDLPTGATAFAAAVYLATYDWRRTLLFFCPAVLPGVLTHQLLNYAITGSMIPTYMNNELKDFAGNYFRHHRSGIDALKEPKHIYAFNALLGHHGLFSMTPIFCFSVWEIGRCIKLRTRLPEALWALAGVGAITAFFIFRSSNYGGWCVGMRHLVPVMALLVVFFGIWLDRVRITKAVWAAVLVAFAISGFHVQDGLTSPFQFSVWHNFLEGAPNRARVGKKWNLGKPESKSKRKSSSKKPKRKATSK